MIRKNDVFFNINLIPIDIMGCNDNLFLYLGGHHIKWFVDAEIRIHQ